MKKYNTQSMKRVFTVVLALICALPCVWSQRREPGKVKTVVIDPGHGGNKPGAIGKNIDEKTIVLSIAKRVGKMIADNYDDVKVIYTRTTDVDIDLSERARIANRAKADLFISIHANSHPTSGPTGMETFVAGLSQSKANMEIAKKENADILLEDDYKNNAEYQGFDPNSPESYVLFAMYQNAYRDKSLTFAQNIQNQYKQHVATIDRGVKQAEFMVLYKTTMPSVLTEVGFISNAKEEAYMMSAEGQQTIAECIVRAFAVYKASEEGEPVAELKLDADIAEPAPATVSQNTAVQPTAGKSETQQTTTAGQVQEKPRKPQPKNDDPEEGKPYTVEKKEPAQPAADQVVYRIQFMTIGRVIEKGDPDLRGIDEFDRYQQGQYYYYLTGRFANSSDAAGELVRVRAKGFKDAIIVAFLNGSRISLQEARRLISGQ